jgi:ABC-2 type transport system ATP-binding protein
MNTMSAASMASAENRGMESGAVIRTEGLTKRFGKTQALTGVGLEVPAGAIYALVGANGAGKTTLIKLLMNILRPTAGSARVLGMDAQSLRGRALNRIGYVSENQEFPEWMTVEGMLAYLRPFYPTWDQALEGQLLQQFDLPAGRKLKQLSRGQRMKAAMASALAFRPSLLVLDEPFAGLDPLVRDELMEGLLDRAPETTIFLSSHDLAEIESFSSHVGFLEQGRLLFSEEMGVLSERFREVTVTLDGSRPVVGNVPPSWLQYEGTDSMVRFVESACRGEETRAEVRERFPGARSIEMEPMALRAIFLAIAKEKRASPTQAKRGPAWDARHNAGEGSRI